MYPNLVITFLIEYKGKFLLIKRPQDKPNFPGLWAFPGGKVEDGETLVDTIRREVKEETNLPIEDNFILLNAYSFKNSRGGYSTGLACMVRAKHDQVIPNEFDEHKWVSHRNELLSLNRIAGIDNHLMNALMALEKGSWQSLEEAQLSEDRYLNK